MSANQEVELKLALPPARAAAFEKWLGERGTPIRHPLVTRYYDTPSGELRARGVALRLRREGRRWMQTVKTEGVQAGGLSTRGEFETPTAAGRFGWERLPQAALDLIPVALRANLVCGFETRFERLALLLEPRAGVAIEVALDVGEIVAGAARAPLCEVELELKAGPPSALLELALSLAGRFDCVPLDPSKAARGAALMRGDPAKPAGAGVPALDAGVTVEDSFVALCQAALAQFQANLPGVLEGDPDPEYLHQARVALRRLRATLRLFRQLCPPPSALRDELKAITAALGPARDADVLALDLLAPIAAALPGGRGGELLGAARTYRARARAALRAELKRARPGRFLLEFQRWLHAMPWRRTVIKAGPLTAPAAAWAARRVERRLRALGRRADRTGSTPLERHALRVAIKRERYALEGMAGLLPDVPTAPALKLLRRLQETLGAANDSRVAREHLARMPGLSEVTRAFADGWLAGAAQAVDVAADLAELADWRSGCLRAKRYERRKSPRRRD